MKHAVEREKGMAFSSAKRVKLREGARLNFELALGRRNGEDEQLNILRKEMKRRKKDKVKVTGVESSPQLALIPFNLRHLHIEISVPMDHTIIKSFKYRKRYVQIFQFYQSGNWNGELNTLLMLIQIINIRLRLILYYFQ